MSMKKTFFQRTFNLSMSTTFFTFLGLWLWFVTRLLTYLVKILSTTHLHDTAVTLSHTLAVAEVSIKTATFLLVIVLFVILTGNCVQRMLYDTLRNYIKSIYQTFRMRQFLRQKEKSEIPMREPQQTKHSNPVLTSFNRSIYKCTVDIRVDTITVFLKIPRSQQAQKLLKEMENHIREEISHQNADYYFSNPIRNGNTLWFVGTKR